MGKSSSVKPLKRPVIIASFGNAKGRITTPEISLKEEEPVATGVAAGLRYNFPSAGDRQFGGFTDDGYCFRITFAAGRLDRTYELVRNFLQENGYSEVPIPCDQEELRRFKLPPKLRHQLSLFGDNGYVHNPIKILFPIPAGHRGALCLEIYNEGEKDHLLRFHRLK